jgi:hypothetical protein
MACFFSLVTAAFQPRELDENAGWHKAGVGAYWMQRLPAFWREIFRKLLERKRPLYAAFFFLLQNVLTRPGLCMLNNIAEIIRDKFFGLIDPFRHVGTEVFNDRTPVGPFFREVVYAVTYGSAYDNKF